MALGLLSTALKALTALLRHFNKSDRSPRNFIELSLYKYFQRRSLKTSSEFPHGDISETARRAL
jgi:hypothetical protein